MNYKCPTCGASYYRECYTASTAIYSPTVYKDGKIVSKDPNWHTTYCLCLNCGESFYIQRHEDEVKIYKE